MICDILFVLHLSGLNGDVEQVRAGRIRSPLTGHQEHTSDYLHCLRYGSCAEATHFNCFFVFPATGYVEGQE
jgi:hypothetical protein